MKKASLVKDSGATERWGSLTWEERQPVPARKSGEPVPRLPRYDHPLQAAAKGQVYRLDFLMGNKRYFYIGYGKSTVRDRLGQHLRKPKDNKIGEPQRMMQLQLESDAISVWTLASTSEITIGEFVIPADFDDRFNLQLFEAAAVEYAKRYCSEVELLNRSESALRSKAAGGVS